MGKWHRSVFGVVSAFVAMGCLSPTVFADTSPGNSPSLPSTMLPNQAINDSSWWSRETNSFYLEASSSPFGTTASTPLLNIEPGSAVSLMAYQFASSVGGVHWLVNSPDASVEPGAADEIWSYNHHRVQMGTFVATKPGVYTVQAESDGHYSVPLVLIVGLSSLRDSATSPPVSAGASGIRPFPATNVPAPSGSSSTSDIQFQQFNPLPTSDWIPVQGTVTGGETSVVVQLSSEQSGLLWNYRLPVVNGGFSALVRSPFTGPVDVSYIPNFFTQLNRDGSYRWDDSYSVTVNGEKTDVLRRALLYSAFMDGNESPAALAIAKTLYDNSPSLPTAAAAIANYASEKVDYNWSMYKSGKYVFADVSSAFASGTGVCEEIAELAATMMKSVGIPAETVLGRAPLSSASVDHEWLQADVNGVWTPMDPTWDSPNQGVNALLTNEYLGDTVGLQTSHAADNTLIGTDQ
ncbi:MAG: hypothetical protein OWS03_09700 [Alicyclobacillaceae bacterium]|nr:hypothetical protein [Alicyclobacillaceae bacterium]